MVVIRGAAMMAGSARTSLASMGRAPPMVLARTTVANRDRVTVTHTSSFPG